MTFVEQSYRKTLPALLVLALSLFVVGTNAFVIAGLLPQVAHGLGATATQVSWSITSYSLVVAVAALRKVLHQQRASHPEMPAQTGGASFAISVLSPPWRQRFEGTVDHANTGSTGAGGFVSVLMIGPRVTQAATKVEIEKLIHP